MTRLARDALQSSDSTLFTLSSLFRILAPSGFDWRSAPSSVYDDSYVPPGATDLVSNSFSFVDGNLPLFEWGFVQRVGDTYNWSAVHVCPYYFDTVAGPFLTSNSTHVLSAAHTGGAMLPAGANIKFTLVGPIDADIAGGYAYGLGSSGTLPMQVWRLQAFVPGFNFSNWHQLLCVADLSNGDQWALSDDFSNPQLTQRVKMAIVLDNTIYKAKWCENVLVFTSADGFFMDRRIYTGTTTSLKNDLVPVLNPMASYLTLRFDPSSALPSTNPTRPTVASDFGAAISNNSLARTLADAPINFAPANASEYSYFQAVRATTQVWFGQYVDPSVPANLDKFWYTAGGKLYPRGGKVAADAFGTPDIWLERDSVSGVLYEQNQGSAGDFTVVGTLPADYAPGPEEGIVIP